VLPIHGLVAGVVFGVAQWLVLRTFLPGLKWWLPATVLASPISWFMAIWFAMATLTFGGWIGSGVSALAQMAVLAVYFRNDTRMASLTILWLPAEVLGGAIFYFAYELSSFNIGRYSPSPWQYILVGTVGFAAITGLVVALLVGLAASQARLGLSSAAARS